MNEYHCRHCKSGRFIGEGEGSGRVRLQCKACGTWQWVRLTDDTAPRTDKAQLTEAVLR